jgi:hypothetical protein
MSLAVAYQMKKRGEKAKGAEKCGPDCPGCKMCHGGMMADGGEIARMKGVHKPASLQTERSDPKWMQGQSKAGGMLEDPAADSRYAADEHRRVLGEIIGMKRKDRSNMAEGGEVQEHDMIDRIMRKHFSKGGEVANETDETADFEDNQFDDLVKDDGLEFHDTGANSGDELGDAQEDEDEHDIIKRIMKSRAVKDRMPRPA